MCSLCLVCRGEVLAIHYMDTTDNLKNGYLDRTASHAPVGTRMLLEMVGLSLLHDFTVFNVSLSTGYQRGRRYVY